MFLDGSGSGIFRGLICNLYPVQDGLYGLWSIVYFFLCNKFASPILGWISRSGIRGRRPRRLLPTRPLWSRRRPLWTSRDFSSPFSAYLSILLVKLFLSWVILKCLDCAKPTLSLLVVAFNSRHIFSILYCNIPSIILLQEPVSSFLIKYGTYRESDVVWHCLSYCVLCLTSRIVTDIPPVIFSAT